mmetsp:Transcript_4344/g.16345  ORF Transcript_4344/g.16345 Transcript_4344/m.16345 type:complete len:263 (+) Transcript_4344:843-1631(+)
MGLRGSISMGYHGKIWRAFWRSNRSMRRSCMRKEPVLGRMTLESNPPHQRVFMSQSSRRRIRQHSPRINRTRILIRAHLTFMFWRTMIWGVGRLRVKSCGLLKVHMSPRCKRTSGPITSRNHHATPKLLYSIEYLPKHKHFPFPPSPPNNLAPHTIIHEACCSKVLFQFCDQTLNSLTNASISTLSTLVRVLPHKTTLRITPGQLNRIIVAISISFHGLFCAKWNLLQIHLQELARYLFEWVYFLRMGSMLLIFLNPLEVAA